MQVIKHGSYKSAGESFTREDLSQENREQIEGYVGAIWERMIEDISKSRGTSSEKLNQIADEMATLDNKNLKETGMIDGLIYYDEMIDILKKRLGVEEEDDLESIRLTTYKDVPLKEKKEFSSFQTYFQ